MAPPMFRPPMVPPPIIKPASCTSSTVITRSSTSSASRTASSREVSSGMVIVRDRLFISISGIKVKPRRRHAPALVTSSTSDSSSTPALWSSEKAMAFR